MRVQSLVGLGLETVIIQPHSERNGKSRRKNGRTLGSEEGGERVGLEVARDLMVEGRPRFQPTGCPEIQG